MNDPLDTGHLEDLARDGVILYSRQLVSEGLVTGTAGNISVRVPSGVLITPSGIPYEHLSRQDICKLDMEGNLLIDNGRDPSSEALLHLLAYQAAPDAQAIVHFHGLASTAVANTVPELPVIHYYAVRLGGAIQVAPYDIFGSEALAKNVSEALQARQAALLANHGAVVIGPTLEAAFNNAKLLEWLCVLYRQSVALGQPRVLTDEEIDQVARKYASRVDDRGTE